LIPVFPRNIREIKCNFIFIFLSFFCAVFRHNLLKLLPDPVCLPCGQHIVQIFKLLHADTVAQFFPLLCRDTVKLRREQLIEPVPDTCHVRQYCPVIILEQYAVQQTVLTRSVQNPLILFLPAESLRNIMRPDIQRQHHAQKQRGT